ncbi:MAG: hypothetical protein ACFFAN_03610 [Promethearchaeota archaeon]
MILEKVQKHKYREDLFFNKVIASQDEVKESEKIAINRILVKEIGLSN